MSATVPLGSPWVGAKIVGLIGSISDWGVVACASKNAKSTNDCIVLALITVPISLWFAEQVDFLNRNGFNFLTFVQFGKPFSPLFN